MTARVVYSFSVSLDGYINSATGSLDWADIDDEIHSWFNGRAREASAFVYGRRLYETMAGYWPTAESDPHASPVEVEFARIWNARPKIVFSRTLESAEHADRLVHTNIVDAISALKAEFDGELDVGGASLAAALVERNLVDLYQLVVHPVVLGGGTPFWPPDTALDLRLVETRRFENGAVLLSYEPARRG